MRRYRRYLLFLGAIAVERVVELVVSARHTARARAAGAVEAGRAHYPAMVAFHALLLPACAVEAAGRARPGRWVARTAMALVVAAEALRWWAVATLGDRWSTRVLVWPGAPPVVAGPYRFVRHPNYLAVAVEVACVPLAGGAFITSAVASALDAALLAVRIRAEERALGETHARAFRQTPRLLPRL